jgi:hypothetical protein
MPHELQVMLIFGMTNRYIIAVVNNDVLCK